MAKWLDKYAMGGSLPGATGMMYARTQNPAPSNGKYAKKTLASAQKGKAITKREDFEPWWNWASVQAAGGERRQQTYGNLGDLYAYYAGQPLKHNVLEHSQYKPTDAKNPKADYISINDSKFKQEVIDNYNRVFNEKKLLRDEKQLNNNTYAVSGYTRPRKEQIKKSKSGELYYEKGKDHVSNAIGHYYLSKGKDEKGDYVSYYDVFDEGTGGSNGGGVGETLGLTKPFELYDRIYLDPKTGKPKMQNGGVIKDDLGQWAYPGEITEIGSNDITMQGVDYPVLGVSDTGDTQMMYPDQDYKFDGEKVVEYPMMQEGGWLDKYQPEPMRQDATRVAPPVLKLTDKEKLENAAKSDQAQKKALNTAKEVIAERKKNNATKGDLNTPGSWNIKEKARLFPSSVGGAGEMFDEYVNPATYVGILGDALGESVAARDPKGIALSLALSAGAGAMGLDPLGSGIKAVKTLTKQLPNAAKYTAGSIYKTYNENIYPILNKEKLAPYADNIAKLNEMNAATKESLKSGELRKRLINQGVTEEEVSNMKVPNLAFFADNKSPGTSYSRYQDINNSRKLEGININFDQLNRLKGGMNITPEAAYEHELGHFLQRPLANKNPLNDLNKYNESLKNYKKDLRIYKKEGEKLANDYGLDKNKVIKDNEKDRSHLLARAMREKDEAAVNWFDRKPQLPERPNYESELDKKVRDLNFNNENIFSNYFNKENEAYPFLREMRQTMVDEGFIKDKYQDINKDAISNFLNSKTKNRLKEALSRKEEESNTDMLHTLLKTLPAVAPAVVASQSQEKKNGGWLNKYK